MIALFRKARADRGVTSFTPLELNSSNLREDYNLLGSVIGRRFRLPRTDRQVMTEVVPFDPDLGEKIPVAAAIEDQLR